MRQVEANPGSCKRGLSLIPVFGKQVVFTVY